MSENSILAGIFRMGDQVKRNLRDFAGNPKDYLDNVAIQNNIEWKKDPVERSMGFFNPVPLGNVTSAALRKTMEDAVTNMSRREFMKKSAGIVGGTAAASIPGAKLLQKFAPEEKQLAKEATAKQVVAETAPKYKYNTLKEYLDDVETSAMSKFDDPRSGGWDVSTQDLMRERLLQDEKAYTYLKEMQKGPRGTKDPKEMAHRAYFDDAPDLFESGEVVYRNGAYHPKSYDDLPTTTRRYIDESAKSIENRMNMFSPQAKKEMKEYKDFASSRQRNLDNWERGLNSNGKPLTSEEISLIHNNLDTLQKDFSMPWTDLNLYNEFKSIPF